MEHNLEEKNRSLFCLRASQKWLYVGLSQLKPFVIELYNGGKLLPE